jgi:RNA polymerase sigma factor (sigma-70 family)
MATTKLSVFLGGLTRAMAAEAWMDWSDRELVERFLTAGDEAAFAALMRRHGPMVYRVCWRVLQHDQDCEDAFQSTFLVLAQKVRTVKNRDSLASWLHGVAQHVALKAQAQAATRRRHERQARKLYAGPPDEIAWRELRTVLDRELARLPEKLRQPLILCYLEARTQDEAASQLGWSKSTLLRRLEEARTTLARRLARKGFALSVPLAAVLLSDCAVSPALPSQLMPRICGAALAVASGKAAAGPVSAKVASLTQGVLDTMFLSKFKTAVMAALLAGLLTGAGILVHQPLASNSLAQEPRAARPASKADARPGPAASTPVWREGASLRGHTDRVSAVAISPDGKLLASGGWDADVILWDRATEKVKARLHGHKEPISGVAFSPDGRLLASGSLNMTKQVGEVKVWDVASGKERAAFKLGEAGGAVWSIAFSPDGKLLAASGDLGRVPGPDDEDRTFGVVTVWELATSKEKATFKEDVLMIRDVHIPAAVSSVTFSPDGKLLAMSILNQVKVRQLATQKVVLTLEEPAKEEELLAVGSAAPMFVTAVFSPDGKSIATAHARAGVKLWDVDTGKERTALAKPEGEGWLVGGPLAFSRDGKTLVTLNNRNRNKDGFHVTSGEVNLWDSSSGKLRQRLAAFDAMLTSVAMSRDGRMLAV